MTPTQVEALPHSLAPIYTQVFFKKVAWTKGEPRPVPFLRESDATDDEKTDKVARVNQQANTRPAK